VGNIDPRTIDAEPGRKIEMMYMTLTLMAGLIAVMFVATAVSSIVNSIRENEAAREAQTRRIAF
jgi:ABC-type polysaccharide/polyol phosphate export permease